MSGNSMDIVPNSKKVRDYKFHVSFMLLNKRTLNISG